MRNSIKYIVSATLAVLSAFTSFAVNDQVVAKKKVAPVEGKTGEYMLTLESWATGAEIHRSSNVATDIVVLLDYSTSMKDPYITYEYTAVSGSSLRTNWKADNYYYNYNNNYYPVKRSGGGTSTNPYRYYIQYGTYNENASNANRIVKNEYTITTSAEIFTRKEVSRTTRLAELKKAYSNYIQTVADNAKSNGIEHRVAVVRYWDNYDVMTKVNGVGDFISLYDPSTKTQRNVNTLKDLINNNNSTHAETHHENAIQAAIDLLNDKSNRTNTAQTVVLLTDGVPYDGGYWYKNVLSDAFTNAYTLKHMTYTIEDETFNPSLYVVNMFAPDNTDTERNWVDPADKYLNYLSSNYPESKKMSQPGTPIADQKYYMNVSEGGLDEAFQDIAYNSEPKISLDATNSSVRDYVTPQFSVLNGGNVDVVKIYTANFTGNSSDGTPQFAEKVLVNDGSIYLAKEDGTRLTGILENDSDNNTAIIVKGFDFASHWVGTIENNSTVTPNPDGQKIIIEIPIKYNTNYGDGGGIVNTNDPKSGIYADADLEQNFEGGNMMAFDQPQAITPKAILKIEKKGLEKGESAIFTVAGDNNTTTRVIVTNNGTEAVAYVQVNMLKSSVKNPTVKSLTADDFVQFTVTEESWAWSTTNSTPSTNTITAPLHYKVGDQWKVNVFTFDATHSNGIKHDEVNKTINR